jgi:predicted metal-dependent HD superfamily phosphohydrolase
LFSVLQRLFLIQKQSYDEYAVQIRKEYVHVSDEDFRVGRAKVLKSFLSKPVLFFTSHAREKLEQRARENVARELAALSNGKI